MSTINELLLSLGYRIYLCSFDQRYMSFVQEENYAVNIICFFDEREQTSTEAQMQAFEEVHRGRLDYGRGKDIHFLRLVVTDATGVGKLVPGTDTHGLEEGSGEKDLGWVDRVWYLIEDANPDPDTGKPLGARLFVPPEAPEDFYGLRGRLESHLASEGISVELPEFNLSEANIGKSITVDELFDKGFEAVFIGSGAGLPRFMNIPGENLKGVYSANEFLTRINLMKAYREVNDTPVMRAKKVAVVGGGNVAMDACRCAKRLGAEEVYIVYRRSLDELPARKEEVEHAMEEGIIFKLLNNPVEILGDDTKSVCGMKCIEMELGEPDASGRRSPVEKAGSEFVRDVDCVIMAIGTSPNPLIKSTTEGLEINKKGGIVVNEDGLTSRDHVYAGGDAVTGAATVILAMGAGKTAAAAIDSELSK